MPGQSDLIQILVFFDTFQKPKAKWCWKQVLGTMELIQKPFDQDHK